MISEGIKKDIQGLIKLYNNEAFSNLTDIIEQITLLFSLKIIDFEENIKEHDSLILGTEYMPFYEEGESVYRWSKFINKSPTEIENILRVEIKNIYKNKRNSSYQTFINYINNTNFIHSDNLSLLTRIIEKINAIFRDYSNKIGDIYDYLLNQMPPNPDLCQYITPRHIINFILELIKPLVDDKIIDVCCGSGGFLVYSKRYILEKYKNELLSDKILNHFNTKQFYGYESDKKLSKFALMNMCFNGINIPNVKRENSLGIFNELKEKYTLAISNIPFSGKEDDDKISIELAKLTKNKNRQLLFINLLIDTLKFGGRCAVIASDGFLFNNKKPYIRAKKRIIDDNKLEAVISMPRGIFKIKNKSGKKSSVSTAIIIFTKTGTGGTDRVWFYDMKADGYSLDDKRSEIEANDIPDIVARFNNLEGESDSKRTEQSFFVSVKEIQENQYDLSINKYKEIEYEEVGYYEPNVILKRVKELEKDIELGIKELERMIEG